MKTVRNFKQMKQKREPIVMMTAYDYPSAQFVEQSGADCILVGDSLGMVVLGYPSTTHVTLDEMIHHGRAVVRGAADTWVVMDMPFMSYHISMSETMNNARRLIQETGAQAVKVEGAGPVVDVIRSLTAAGIPVVAHLGLTPQSVGVLGGYRVQGRTKAEAEQLLADAIAVEAAGAAMLVLECVPSEVATHISESIGIPTIGIGAGSETDGQVLVYHDVIGYGFHHVPKFAHQYTQVAPNIVDALTNYTLDVRTRAFPKREHEFLLDTDTKVALYGGKA
ncbi:MAG: 3-methyl-2-oxobutanoate hydroxymethyltransferase [Bacilli bacterium]